MVGVAGRRVLHDVLFGSHTECVDEHDSVIPEPAVPQAGGELTIDSYRNPSGVLCYSVTTVSAEVIHSGCPEVDLSAGELTFGGRERYGTEWYAVVWIADGVDLVDSSNPYSRSDEGWTVFYSSMDGHVWFDAVNLGATFHCTVEFLSVNCTMVSGP